MIDYPYGVTLDTSSWSSNKPFGVGPYGYTRESTGPGLLINTTYDYSFKADLLWCDKCCSDCNAICMQPRLPLAETPRPPFRLNRITKAIHALHD